MKSKDLITHHSCTDRIPGVRLDVQELALGKLRIVSTANSKDLCSASLHRMLQRNFYGNPVVMPGNS